MTREKCKKILPVIEAFVNGECIEFYDSLEITGTFTRGQWKTAENIGFGRSVNDYRMVKNDKIIYFDEKLF